MSESNSEISPDLKADIITPEFIDQYFDIELPVSEDEVPELSLAENNFIQRELLKKAREMNRNLDSVNFINKLSPIFKGLKKNVKVRWLIINKPQEAIEKIWQMIEEKYRFLLN
jgi:hypothetical protein